MDLDGRGSGNVERTPAGWVVARCTSSRCRARIVWARTEAGKSAPYDADPSSIGTTELDGVGPTPQARYIVKGDRAGRTDLHLSHYATCPDAKAFRKGRS